jgi:adenylate cyclase
VIWFGNAAGGSALILVIDAVVSAVVKGFRHRLVVAVLSLLAVTMVASVVIALAISQPLFEANLQVVPVAGGNYSVTRGGPNAMSVRLAVGMSFAIAAVLGLPAILSACGKLADAAMDRVRPLSFAFDSLASGARDVRLEEAGSTEFLQVAQSFNKMVGALALAEQMERAFGVYVSGQLIERIRAQHGEAALPAAKRVATVLFADIRGFTPLTERIEPEAMVALLNRYFEKVVQIVDAHEGYLNKFIGDAVVVVFNGPIDQPDHAARAARFALALQAEVSAMNAAGQFPEAGGLQIGVGVSTGPMVCANVGGRRHMEYTVIGDTVNLAARLTSRAGGGEIWISEGTARGVGEGFSATPLEPIQVKGKELPVTPYRLQAPELPAQLRA